METKEILNRSIIFSKIENLRQDLYKLILSYDFKIIKPKNETLTFFSNSLCKEYKGKIICIEKFDLTFEVTVKTIKGIEILDLKDFGDIHDLCLISSIIETNI